MEWALDLLPQILNLRLYKTSRVMELKISLIYPLLYFPCAPGLIIAGHKLLSALLISMRNGLKRLAYCSISVSFE